MDTTKAYLIYKLIHLLGLGMVFLSFGGMTMHAILGGEKQNDWRKPAIIGHGLGLFLMLLGGFGLLARMGIHWPWPPWVTGKFVIWLLFGGSVALIYKKPAMSKLLWFVSVALLGVAAYLALFKPGA